MKLLLVAATELETAIFRERFFLPRSSPTLFLSENGQIGLLHTGIGMVNTAFQLGQIFAQHQVETAVQFGIAGTYDRAFSLGDVVEVVSDCFPELGADTPTGMIDLKEMGFPIWTNGTNPLYNQLENPLPSTRGLPQVTGMTVNRVSGDEARIAERYQRWPSQTESMEGAAFFQACLMADVPFYAFRSLSNYVESRNRANWEIKRALETIQAFIFAFVQDFV